MSEPTKRVAALDADGNFGTVDAADAEAVERAGGRLLTKQEVAAREADEAYAKAPLIDKVTGLASAAGPIPAAIGAGIRSLTTGNLAPTLPPELQSYAHGVSQSMAGGVPEAAVHEALKAVSGDQAAKAYADTIHNASEGYGGYETAGNVAGLVGGAFAGGPASAAGGLAEGAAARATAGLATKGVMGRALATGAQLGARGAVEGALYGGASQLSEDMLGDREATADKLFAAIGTGALYGGAGGAVLGTGGSLVKSGVTATAGSARSSLSRILNRGNEALTEGGASAALKDQANAQAWKAVGAGYGLQSTRYAKQAAKYLPQGEKSVGEVLMRKGILNADDGLVSAVRNATPEAMAPKIAGELEKVGSRIGEITDASGAVISRADIDKAFRPVLEQYGKIAGREGEVAAIEQYKSAIISKLGLDAEEKIQQGVGHAIAAGDYDTAAALQQQLATARTHAPIQDVLAQRKGLDGIIYAEQKTLDPKGRLAALRDIRGQVEDLIMSKMDDASGKVPGALKAEYQALKKDYVALSIAKDAAEDSAARAAKGATLGVGEKFAVGSALATGNLMAAPVLGFGGKLVRERGNAAAAVMLSKLSDMQSLTRTVAKVDETITRASRGVLEAPKSVPQLSYREPARVHAERVSKQVLDAQANPEQFVERIQSVTEGMSATAPNLAGGLTKRMTDAVAFLATKLPRQPAPDPFDPHPAVKMTPTQAMEFSRYASYVEQPARFFEEASNGQITFEGVEVAKALMPDAFAEMQARTAESLAELLARGVRIPIRQRERLGLLMDFPAVPSQRPDHIAFLQGNVVGSEQASQAPSRPNKPIPTRPQQTTFDRLEEGSSDL